MNDVICINCGRSHPKTIVDHSPVALICRFKCTHNDDDFADFLAVFQNPLRRMIHHIINRLNCSHLLDQYVDDLQQNAALRIYLKMDLFDCQCELESWAYTVANRLVIDFLRTIGPQPLSLASLTDGDDSDFDPAAPADDKFASDVADDLVEWIRTHRKLFTAKQYAVLERLAAGMTAAEIASDLGISPVAVHCRAARAFEIIREYFGNIGPGESTC